MCVLVSFLWGAEQQTQVSQESLSNNSQCRENRPIDNKLIKVLRWVREESHVPPESFLHSSEVRTPRLGSTLSGFKVASVDLYGFRDPPFLLWKLFFSGYWDPLLQGPALAWPPGRGAGVPVWYWPLPPLYFPFCDKFKLFCLQTYILKWLNQLRIIVSKLPLASTHSKHHYIKDFMLWVPE